MNHTRAASPSRIVTLSTRLYARLLAAYPPRFRAEYGPHMAQVFRDSCRDSYGQRRLAGLAWLWLATLADWGVTIMSEWFAGRPGPGHFLQKFGVGLAAGMAGGIVAGLGSRLSMRGVALAGGLIPSFSLEGTLVIMLVGLMLGLPLGVGYLALRRFLPGDDLGKGLAYGLMLTLVFLMPPLLFYREGEALLASPLLGLALFSPLGPLYGATVALAAARLERRLLPQPKPVSEPHPRGSQLLATVAFAGLLELSVLAVLSIANSAPRVPLGVIRVVRQVQLSFEVAWGINDLLVTLVALGYFGLSALIFWQRTRSPLPRLAATALLLFGGALFNTGATYFHQLMFNLDVLRPLFHGLQIVGCTAIVALLYLFPNGRWAARWLVSLALSWVAWALVWLLTPGLPDWLTIFALIVFLGAGVLAQLRRYRQAPAAEQEQLRWPARGFAAALAGFALVAVLSVAVPGLTLPRVTGPATAMTFAPFILPWLFLPGSIGYAMWRRRLWAE